MEHVYWIGGSPCAGKTTITSIIAQELGWQTYHLDRHVESYLERATEQHPYLQRYKQIGMLHFLNRPAQTQLQDVLGMSGEQFTFLLSDVRARPKQPPLLVEGANMLPQDVVRVSATVERIIWLVPSEDFLLDTYPRRGQWVQDVLRQYPTEAERLTVFDHWMERDALMAQWTAQAARDLGIRVITVNGKRTLLENTELVATHFGLL